MGTLVHTVQVDFTWSSIVVHKAKVHVTVGQPMVKMCQFTLFKYVSVGELMGWSVY